MKFCDKCDNMFYIKLNDNSLEYYCRKCGNVDKTITQEGVCVIDTKFKNKEQTFDHIINKYTKLDPTLPRLYNIKCPCAICKTNDVGAKDPAEVIYLRYDDVNLKYVYICNTCDTMWKTDDNIRNV